MKYLMDRLREPGTLRSLAVVLFALLGIGPEDPVFQATVQLAILLLGGASAVMPEAKAPVVPAQELVAEVRQALRSATDTAVRAHMGAGKQ